MEHTKFNLRNAQPSDTPVLLEIVGGIFKEYGITFDPNGWDKDLQDPAANYLPPDAIFKIVEYQNKIVGMVGGHKEDNFVELHRLYIDKNCRGMGLGHYLCQFIEEWAKEQDAEHMLLWSDVRFIHAHKLYRKRGYQTSDCRILDDPDKSIEYGMGKTLNTPAQWAESALIETLKENLQWTPLQKLSREQLYIAQHIVAGMLDTRNFVEENRLSGDAITLPQINEIFYQTPDSIDVLVYQAMIAGFRSLKETHIHPSCLD